MERRDEVRDVVVVGGSAAGLSAALTLARGREEVLGWVAGNASHLSAQVSAAGVAGARAAQHINADLVMDDVGRAVAAHEGVGASR